MNFHAGYLCIPLAVIIVIGVVGNIISCLIWFRGKKCSSAASSTYFRLLAISDVLILLIPATIGTLDLANKLSPFLPVVNDFLPEANKVEYQNNFVCKFHSFTYMALPQLSAWITVVLTTERTLCLCFPLKFYRTNASRRAYVIIGVISLASLALNITEITHQQIKIYRTGFQPDNGVFIPLNYTLCAGTKLVLLLESISFLVFTFALPFVILIFCNIVIIVKLCQPPPTSSQNEARQRSIRNITKLTLYISVVQCITNIPRTYYELLNHNIIEGDIMLSEYSQLYIEAAFVCYYMNNSVNWLIYCIIGKDFRDDFKELRKTWKSCCDACCGSCLEPTLSDHTVPSRRGFVIQRYGEQPSSTELTGTFTSSQRTGTTSANTNV